MLLRGESANLLSVGAIDFGLVVDATVIMVENIIRRLSEPPSRRFSRSMVVHSSRASTELRGKFAVIANAATEVNKSIFFSAAIIIAGFVPLFTMSGIEGHIFGPMAKTYAYAIAGGLLATFTVTPALCGLMLPRARKRERHAARAVSAPDLRAHGALRLGQSHLTLGSLASCCWCLPVSRCGLSGWSSCRSWRKAICGSAPPCRPRSPWKAANRS